MLLSIITCLWIVLLAAVSEHALNAKYDKDAKFLSLVGKDGWIQAAVLGILVGASNFMASKGLVFAIIAFVLTTVVMVYIAWWYCNNVTIWQEFALFVLMTIPVGFVLLQAGAGIAESITNPFWISLWMILPWMAITVFATYLLAILLLDVSKVAVWIISILAVIGLAAQVIFGLNWASLKPVPEEPAPVAETTPAPKPEPSPAPVEEVEEEIIWYHFYNTEMLANEDVKDDFNFGPYPLEALFIAKVANGELGVEDIANKSVDELIAMVTPEELEDEFWTRLSNDPALGATTTAWTDVKLGTRYLGKFYEACKEEWATTMNAAKEDWMNDQEAYNRTLAAMRAFYRTAKSIEIVHVKGGLDDQMYMNPYTIDLVPDIIVMESADQQGYFLRYTFEIKGKEITVDYRIDCGYQPTNVAKLMKIDPQPNPNKPKPTPTPKPDPGKPSGGDPDDGKSSGGDPDDGKSSGGDPGYYNGGPTTPPVQAPKDPDKGLPKEEVKNDTPGPGPDTNNGVGAQYSREELPTNSIFDTYEEYKEEIKELIEVNENQKVGGDPNVPTVPAPEGTNVDSNADTGTGFGGIDVATPIHETHVESTLGGDGSNAGNNTTSDDPVGVEWGGPQD